MSFAAVDTSLAGTSEAVAPQIFVRGLSVPPGLPWQQSRAAALEARFGSPLPIEELKYQVRRLDAWSPGRPARFGAFYVRTKDARQPMQRTVELDGQSMIVRFGQQPIDLSRWKTAAAPTLSLIVTVCLALGSLFLATQRKQDLELNLQRVERLADQRVRLAEAYRSKALLAQQLDANVGNARPLSEVLKDLSWVAANRTQDAKILAVHWERGLLAIEARSESAPFQSSDRAIQRANRAIRPGVWLWSVGSGDDALLAQSPSAAQMRP